MDKRSFGSRLKIARHNKGLTADQFSDKIGLSSKSIWQLEAGHRSTSLTMLVKICNALEISPNYLLEADLSNSSYSYNKLIMLLARLSASDRTMLTEMLKAYLSNK